MSLIDNNKPKWHITLGDGTTTLGFRTCDGRGNPDPRSMISNPYPQYASQLRQGRTRYADRVPPFVDIAIDDFSGGRGELHHDIDRSMYWDGYRVDTRKQGRVVLGPLETHCEGIRDFEQEFPGEWFEADLGDYDWVEMYDQGGSQDYTTIKTPVFDPDTFTTSGVVLWLRKYGSPTGDISVKLYNNDTSTLLKTATLSATSLDYETNKYFFSFSQSVVTGTNYYIQIEHSGTENNHVLLPYNGTISLITSPPNASFYFRLLDNTDDFGGKFFTYRGLTYLVTQPDDHSASKIYMNGDRGVADDNSGDKSLLNDSTKSWSTGEWREDYVYIINGPGSDEEQPWREITNNDGTSLTVSPDWEITHTTDTEYIIISRTKFNEVTISSVDEYVTDVAVAGRFVYFAMGTDQYIARYEAYNDGGAFTERDTNESVVKGHKLAAISEPSLRGQERRITLMVSQQYSKDWGVGRGSLVASWRVPMYWEDLYNVLDEPAFPTNEPWDKEISGSGVIVKLDDPVGDADSVLFGGATAIELEAAFTTGVAAAKKIDAVDIREGSGYIFAIYPTSNSWSAGDVELLINGAKSYELPALTQDEWNFVNIDFDTDGKLSTEDTSEVKTAGLRIDTDQGVETFYFWPYGIQVRNDRIQTQYLPYYAKVNSIIEYAGGEGQTEKKVWAFTDKGAFYDEAGALVELYLREIRELQHPRNGEGVTVNDSYIYFNVGESIQRYYAGTLDNVGPDAGYGLPENRRGIPGSLASYPGHVFAAVDAGDNYSSILVRRNHGWHELYRAREGKRIRAIHVQGVSGQPDRLWFIEGADISWIPVALNPETEEDYYYNFYGSITTGRIYGGQRGTEKYFDSLEIVWEDDDYSVDGNRYVEIDYKKSGDTSWSYLGKFTSTPKDSLDISDTGRWIQFRARIYTEQMEYSPVIVSLVLDMLERNEVNNSFRYKVLLPGDDDYNLKGDKDDYTGVEKWEQLQDWIDDADTLTLRSVSGFEDNKTVFIEPGGLRMIYHKMDKPDNEKRVAEITLLEI